ncbi:hypothetical protein Salat_2438500 [Sesamum alatum]|uniref:Uncharacterized protein n=1 Tax=Sesamum alatum TaxID=300844 RepID=A0AAE1XZ05_9LAMI|nr:hypothetical protein Salat_2438500 [Sesamum alatum]
MSLVTTVGSPIAEDVGTEGSVECVPSTIPENRSTGILTSQGVGIDRLEEALVTVPLRFNAQGPPGRMGLGRRGQPRGSGGAVSKKRPRDRLIANVIFGTAGKGARVAQPPRSYGRSFSSVPRLSPLGTKRSSKILAATEIRRRLATAETRRRLATAEIRRRLATASAAQIIKLKSPFIPRQVSSSPRHRKRSPDPSLPLQDLSSPVQDPSSPHQDPPSPLQDPPSPHHCKSCQRHSSFLAREESRMQE